MAGLSVPASAQETTETVVVTGSRIPQTGLYSSSPVTAVGQQEMKFEGTSSVETLINNLPQSFADFGQTASNGATGTATVNLRGLGSARTLVLIDGRRLLPGDIAFPVPDLNQIPAALVDHIEVLTGGASAVYGSDAEAGVVNFIMRKDFEGVEFDGTWSEAQHDQHNGVIEAATKAANTGIPINLPTGSTWDGRNVDATVMMGINSPNGKGNVTAYAGYRNVEALTQNKRDFSDCVTLTNFYAVPPTKPFQNFFCGGSSTNPGGRFVPLTGPHQFASEEATGNGTFVPFNIGQFGFNFAPYNFLQRPDERYTGGVMGHYEVNP
ncbi:MAG: TonB-dependent receptor, partial [Alphaproteobacteria bacterium]|nr:TonB-dependent receptor [Alphaproteobacteria bacterium]